MYILLAKLIIKHDICLVVRKLLLWGNMQVKYKLKLEKVGSCQKWERMNERWLDLIPKIYTFRFKKLRVCKVEMKQDIRCKFWKSR